VVSFHFAHKSGSVVSERSAPCHFLMHVPDAQSGYRELGLELVSLEENFSHMPKKPSMVGENKYDGTRDPFKIFLRNPLSDRGTR
jgi:hypothetical protein